MGAGNGDHRRAKYPIWSANGRRITPHYIGWALNFGAGRRSHNCLGYALAASEEQDGPVTRPMAKARGFSPPAWSRQTSYLPGVLGNYRVPKPPDTWRLQADRDCFMPGRFVPGNTANTRSGVQMRSADRRPHTGSAPVRTSVLYHADCLPARGHSPPCLKAGARWPR
jgi:hypothetical protein